MNDTVFTQDLLIEIGCEELPPKSLRLLETQFSNALATALQTAELSFRSIQGFSTPRRIAVIVEKLALTQPQRIINKRGPATTVAFDKLGNPTTAAVGFAKSCGVSIQDLSINTTETGTWLNFEQTISGQSTVSLLPNILTEILQTLPIGRRMRWGSHRHDFARPIHWITLLFGPEPIQTTLFDLPTNHYTIGHRFHHPKPIALNNPSAYESLLSTVGFVIPDYQKRKAEILKQITAIAKELHYYPVLNEALLEEVTGLVEWPVVLVGTFEASFLSIPKEVLITAMQNHQKCFPILDNHNQLLNKFLLVSNINSKTPEAVIQGNECVMHARLKDAVFYYESDQAVTLDSRLPALSTVIFQQGLGSLLDKSKRIANLARKIAPLLQADPAAVHRAALLSKSDLLTNMVGEFPELQGVMGRYYALTDKESTSVALAIEEQYYPRFANDRLPTTREGAALAIADRIDTLVGLFGIGKKPTGDKDPFSLRRQALGILRILVEKEIPLDLIFLIESAVSEYSLSFSKTLPQEVLHFCYERLRAWYQERSVAPRVFESVFSRCPTDPLDFHYRIKAVEAFINLPACDSLASVNKRVQNLLNKNNHDPRHTSTVSIEYLVDPAEKILHTEILKHQATLQPLLEKHAYTEALVQLATLSEPVDQFFQEVMVMSPDPKLKNNRLALLNLLRSLFLSIADVSLL